MLPDTLAGLNNMVVLHSIEISECVQITPSDVAPTACISKHSMNGSVEGRRRIHSTAVLVVLVITTYIVVPQLGMACDTTSQ